jgi:hypothetical protein
MIPSAARVVGRRGGGANSSFIQCVRSIKIEFLPDRCR